MSCTILREKQDRKTTFNVTLRRVHERMSPWKSNKNCIFSVSMCTHSRGSVNACACVRACWCQRGCRGAGVCCCECSLNSRTRNAHAPYCLQPLWIHQIFRHYLINSTISGKSFWTLNLCFGFSYEFSFEIFLILRRIQRDIVINVKKFRVKYPLFLSDFNDTWTF